MGHAIHFLQRIERLTPAQADLALTLYREPKLVAHLLAHLLRRIRLPDAAERVALALEDAPQSPHVIVTRDGRVVTCLGPGMAFDCPVVSRQQIDNASEKLDALRDAISREKGELKRLYDRLLDRGSAVSREDFGVLAALVPLLGNEFMRIAMDLLKFVAHFRSGFRRSRYRNVTSRVYDELHRYWTAMWAIGHLAAICGERADDVRAMGPKRRGAVPDVHAGDGDRADVLHDHADRDARDLDRGARRSRAAGVDPAGIAGRAHRRGRVEVRPAAREVQALLRRRRVGAASAAPRLMGPAPGAGAAPPLTAAWYRS